MKAKDIVLQLQNKLPMLVEDFTDNFSVTSMTRSGTTVTVETSSAHGFTVNKIASILGSKIPLSISSFTRTGTLGVIVTTTNHDFTFDNQLGKAISNDGEENAEVSGATEPEFNGSFKILRAPDRLTLEVEMVDSGPTAATGTPILENGSNFLNSYDGPHKIETVPTTTSFTFETTLSGLDPVGTIEVRGCPRISSTISLQRILDAYTEQPQNDLWAFVVLGDTDASKSRAIQSDATDNIQRGNFYRQQIIQDFAVYVVFPCTNQIAARECRDDAESLLRPICQSVLFERFNTYLYNSFDAPTQFLNHGSEDYNTAFYIHRYEFQQTAYLQFEDTVGYSEDVAFRDLNFNMGVDIGEEVLTAKIDLDEDSLL